MDDDADWYYIGRISVNEWQAERAVGKLTIECDCEPYKMADTEVFQMVSGEAVEVILPNAKKHVIPLITITGNVELTFGTNYYALTDGPYELPGVTLVEGENTIKLDGTGTATFEYVQRGL